MEFSTECEVGKSDYFEHSGKGSIGYKVENMRCG